MNAYAGDKADLIPKFNAWDKAIAGSQQPSWREEARECFAMVAGDQLKSNDDKEEAESRGILYAILNKIDPTVSAICGSEITNRQEVRYYPREMTSKGPDGQSQDAKVNEIYTAAAEWVRDECDAADEESEAFRDCIICGMGWTETRMTYDLDPDGMAVIERVDGLEMAWDASARRPNLADKRYLRRKKRFSKAEAAEKFNIDPNAYGQGENTFSRTEPHNADKEAAYQGKGEPPIRKDELEITEYQWFELEPAYQVANPMTGQTEVLTQEEFQKAQAAGLTLQHQQIKKRCYYRAWRIEDTIIKHEKLPEEEFTLKCVTGKLDRNKGVWYGVVRAMIDPQRLLNKQVTQLQRIIDVTAKGGLLAESDAFEDPEQAKEDWAASDTIVFTKPGAVSKAAVIPKPIGQYPSAIDKMLMMTLEMVPGVSGVNNEMLGIIDREQAGVVDWQRKQAAYGVLAGFFNSLRRYRRMQGRLLLKLITRYMSDGRLVRLTDKGNVRYMPLVKDQNTARYDVVVDEAPAGPNQKERTFLFLMQFGPMLAKLGLPPQMWFKLMEYTPLPTSLVAELQQIQQQMPPQQDPKAQAAMAKVQADAQADQARLQMEGQRAAQEMQLEQAKTAAELQSEERRARIEAEQQAREAMIMAAIKRMEAEGNLRIKEQEMAMQARLDMMQFRFEAAMQQREQAFEERMREKEVAAQVKAANAKNGGGSGTRFGGKPG